MKKNFKLMLVALLAVFGFSTAMAQAPNVGAEIAVDRYNYTVTKQSTQKSNGTITTGEVEITSLVQGKTINNGENLVFPGAIEYQVGNVTYKYNVTTMSPDVFSTSASEGRYDVKKAVIPAQLTEIPTGAFNTLTNLYQITFDSGEDGSHVKKIGPQAFASTQITEFDFSPCTRLEGLMDGVFVQTTTGTNNKNANIKKIKLPTSTEFKHINGAFRNLTALTTIENLDKSWIRELVDGAFDGCESLKTLSLPGNDLQYISSKALEGSAIEDLTINTGENATNGNNLVLLGGCTVDYVFDEVNKSYIYNYEGTAYTEGVTAYNTAATAYNTLNELEEGEPGYMEQKTAVEWVQPYEATTNLYGLNGTQWTAGTIAPLRKLAINGTLGGKICKNSFAWCSNIADASKATTVVAEPSFSLGIDFGSKGQIQTNAFLKCTHITSLTLKDIQDNQLQAGLYTIEANAFEDCPIATLILGDILTENAIGSAAFGKKLKNVTIGTVEAGDAAFQGAVDDVPGAFVWDNVSGATLNLANAEGKYVSSENPEGYKVIPAGVFDFRAINKDATVETGETLTYPEVWIGEIRSQGGVFAQGAIDGVNVDKLHFTGNINAKGLDVSILNVTETPTKTWEFVPDEPTLKVYGALPAGGLVVADPANITAADADKFIKIKNITGTTLPAIPDGTDDKKYVKIVSVDGPTATLETEAKTYEYTDVAEGDIVDKIADYEDGKYISAGGGKYYQLTNVQTENKVNNILSELTFEGDIKTNGIGQGAFINLPYLESVTFSGLLSKEAVASKSFTGTGLENEKTGFIGTEEEPFVIYTADLTDNDAAENPFATDAFADATEERDPVAGPHFFDEGQPRIIYWSITDEKLRKNISIGIHQAADAEYDGENVHGKFNIYKWVDLLAEEDQNMLDGFIVFTDNKANALDQNLDKTVAWGRYDLGSFEAEKGIFYDEDATLDEILANPEKAGYQQSDMIIDRFQTTTDVDGKSEYNVKVTLYGLYWDENDQAKQSDVYLVPLEVIDGKYYIHGDNKHLIIAKVKNLDGEFAEDRILVQYEALGIDESGDFAESELEDNENSVWTQLQVETMGGGSVQGIQLNADGDPYETTMKRVFQKADYTWTNQELCDKVENLAGSQNTDGKDLYALLDPSKNAGFDVKRFEIERKTDGTGAFIGEGWYYALLNNYGDQNNAARIIWLDEEEATAIFGVQQDGKVAVKNVKTGAIYNMLGQKVSKSYRGVIIMDGKKYFNK